MNIDSKYPSKERVERDGRLVYAEGDDIPETDVDELRRQGYHLEETAQTVTAPERIERDGVLVYAEGDEIPAEVAKELGVKAASKTKAEAPAEKTTAPKPAKKAPAKKAAKAAKKATAKKSA